MSPFDVPGFDFDLTEDEYDTLVWAGELEEETDDVYWVVAEDHARRVALRRCLKLGLMEESRARVPYYCQRYPNCGGARGRCVVTSCDTTRRGFGLTDLGREWLSVLDAVTT